MATAFSTPPFMFAASRPRTWPSTASATISSGLPLGTTCSSSGTSSWGLVSFRSVIRMYGSSSSATIFSLSVAMAGER